RQRTSLVVPTYFREGPLGDQAQTEADGDRVRPLVDAELGEDRLAVRADRRLGDAEQARDLRTARALGHVAEDLLVAGVQRLGPGSDLLQARREAQGVRGQPRHAA